MRDKIQEAFGQVRATEQMKRSVSDYLIQEMEKKKKRSGIAVLKPIFAALLLCFVLGGWYYWEKPVSYVSVDVNPSIELTLNGMNYVVRAESRNKDGERVLRHLQLKGKSYLDAVELLLESEAMQGYLTADADLTFTVASPKEEELLSELKGSAATMQHHGTCVGADLENVATAHAHGMSLGKYQIYELLSQYDADLTTEECQHMTMCQLYQKLSWYECEEDNSGNEGNMESGCGHEDGHCHEKHSHHHK